MKTFIATAVVFLLLHPAFAQSPKHTLGANQTLLQSGFYRITYNYNPVKWTAFVQTGPRFLIIEAGPRVIRGPFSAAIRLGTRAVPRSDGALIVHQKALVLVFNRGQINAVAIYENSPIDEVEHYYLSTFFFRNVGVRVEAMFFDGGFEPFLGPTWRLKVGPGNMYLWVGKRLSHKNLVALWGYTVKFN